jgi:hypothetical protein
MPPSGRAFGWAMSDQFSGPPLAVVASGYEQPYELRFYRCVPGRKPALLSRFENEMLRIWEKHGILLTTSKPSTGRMGR